MRSTSRPFRCSRWAGCTGCASRSATAPAPTARRTSSSCSTSRCRGWSPREASTRPGCSPPSSRSCTPAPTRRGTTRSTSTGGTPAGVRARARWRSGSSSPRGPRRPPPPRRRSTASPAPSGTCWSWSADPGRCRPPGTRRSSGPQRRRDGVRRGRGRAVAQRRGAPPRRELVAARLRTTSGDGYDVVVGLVDGYAGSVRVRHEGRIEVFDSVGSE